MIRIAILCCLVVPCAQAQFDPGGPNAILAVNGMIPSSVDPLGHNVVLPAPGSVVLSVSSGSNQFAGFILLGGPVDAPLSTGSGNVVSTPWGGSLDVGTPGSPPTNIAILLDGIGQTIGPLDLIANTGFTGVFALAGAVPASATGLAAGGFQAAVEDPTMPPFLIDNTQVADVSFSVGAPIVTVHDLPDDGWIIHTLSGAISFGGALYTNFVISSNGYIAMSSGNSDWTPTFLELSAGFQDSPTSAVNPGVALFWSDLNPGGSASGSQYIVTEYPADGSVTVRFEDMKYWTSQEDAGDAEVTFGFSGVPGWLRFDHSSVQAGPNSTDDVLVGITDGDDQVGTDTTLDLALAIDGGYTTFNGPETLGQLWLAAAPIGLPGIASGGLWSALDLGNGTTVPYFTWTLFP